MVAAAEPGDGQHRPARDEADAAQRRDRPQNLRAFHCERHRMLSASPLPPPQAPPEATGALATHRRGRRASPRRARCRRSSTLPRPSARRPWPRQRAPAAPRRAAGGTVAGPGQGTAAASAAADCRQDKRGHSYLHARLEGWGAAVGLERGFQRVRPEGPDANAGRAQDAGPQLHAARVHGQPGPRVGWGLRRWRPAPAQG